MSDLTPYDTGERLEPQLWVQPSQIENAAGRADWLPDLNDFGKVDFDNDEGATIATVWFERDAKNGGYMLHVQPFITPINLNIKWEEDEERCPF